MGKFEDIVQKYNKFSLDGTDAPIKEIESLQFLWNENPYFDQPSETVDPLKKLVVVLVEARLLNDIKNSKYSKQDLLTRLLILKYDLLREGRQAKFFRMQAYTGPVHQDGKTLLAIREFFKAIRNSFSNFEGALLLGSFPEASIVRTWPQGPDEFSGEYRVGGPVDNFTPRRFELVLADLDGNWEEIYHEQINVFSYRFQITSSTDVSQNGTKVTLRNSLVTKDTHSLEDVFWIQDESCHIIGSTVELDTTCLDPEVSPTDSSQKNPVARPKISVSRINARSIAVQPPNSRFALDEKGKPQKTKEPIDYSYDRWTHDESLERTLLIEYFDRNHAFRSGRYSQQPFSISLIESGNLGTTLAENGMQGLNFPRDKEVRDANLLEFVRWLKRPAIFRVISSHADCSSTTLLAESDADASLAEIEAGGCPWRWIEENGYYIPSFKGHSSADLFSFRTLWENKALNQLPSSLLMHIGCSVNSVSHPEVLYSQAPYGTFQNAESLLFYANQLAVLCHATDWNAGPLGFGNAFSDEKSVLGDGWGGISEHTSQDAALAKRSTQRKQNYMWGIIGDWTLQKYYPASFSSAKKIIASRNKDKRIALFYIGADDKLYYDFQITPNGAWATDIWLGGWAKQIQSASNQDGRLEVIYIGSDNKLYHIWQATPNGGWSLSSVLDNGSYAKQLSVGSNKDGRLEVIYIGSDNKLYHIWQAAPNGGWSLSSVLDNGSYAKQLSIGSNKDGRLEVIYIGSDNKLYHIWQAAPNGGWSLSSVLDNGSYAKQLSIGSNKDGRLEVIYIGSDNKLYHIWQAAPNGSWSLSSVLDNGSYAKQLSVGSNKDGRLEVIYIGSDNKLYHIWQAAPNGGWSLSSVLDNGSYAMQLVTGQNADGRLEVIYIGSDNKLYHIWQATPNGGWTQSYILNE